MFQGTKNPLKQILLVELYYGANSPYLHKPNDSMQIRNCSIWLWETCKHCDSWVCSKPHWKHQSAHTSLTRSHFVDGPAAVYSIRDQFYGEPTDTATCLIALQVAQQVCLLAGGSPGQYLSRYCGHSKKADGIVSNYDFPASKEPSAIKPPMF